MLKIVALSVAALFLVLSLSEAYEYLNYDDDTAEILGRGPVVPQGIQRKQDIVEPRQGGRFRRQGDGGEYQRHRRQGGHEGVTGPVHTFVKTDEHAHFKWGVRHHVGHEYAGRR